MPTDEQQSWMETLLARVPGVALGAAAPAAPAASKAEDAPLDPDWAQKFAAEEAKSEADYQKRYQAVLDAIDKANAQFEKEQRAPHPGPPRDVLPRAGTFKTPDQVTEIELMTAAENHLALQLEIALPPEGHQLAVRLYSLLNQMREVASWRFAKGGTQQVTATVYAGLYELAFESERLADRRRPGEPIQGYYRLTLAPQPAKPKPAPRPAKPQAAHAVGGHAAK